MVQKSPLTAGGLTLRKFKSTVINDIFVEITFFSVVATSMPVSFSFMTHSGNSSCTPFFFFLFSRRSRFSIQAQPRECLVDVQRLERLTWRHMQGINNQLLTVLGTVLGLVVSFRTSSAYDRFWEGRKLWSNILLA